MTARLPHPINDHEANCPDCLWVIAEERAAQHGGRMTAPMQDRVSPETYEQLRSMVAPYGWTPMLSEHEGLYRAWMRKDGYRMWGTAYHADPDDAARELIAKVTPMVPR